MSDTAQQLALLESKQNQTPFTPFEEEAVIALILDHPNLFDSSIKYLKPELFNRLECQFVVAELLNIHSTHNMVPTRKLLRNQIEKKLTVSDPFEDIFRIVDKKSDPREVPVIKANLLLWLKKQAFGLLYSQEAIDAFHRGDIDTLTNIVEESNKITDINEKGIWFLNSLEMLLEPEILDHRTTGFPQLDRVLNNGGPSPKEVLCWLAPTNVGKSLLMCNNAITSLKGLGANGTPGQDVLFVTFELDAVKTSLRCLGAATGIPLNMFNSHKDNIRKRMLELQENNKRLYICELPPDECSVDDIRFIIDKLRRTMGWKPDVIILDYMDLMISRNKFYNRDDYKRLSHIATEIRGLAKHESALIFTATQTNRTGMMDTNKPIDMTKTAESFGKQFALDYIISLNQSDADRIATPARLQMFVTKNRNGARNVLINCTINYDSMQVFEART